MLRRLSPERQREASADTAEWFHKQSQLNETITQAADDEPSAPRGCLSQEAADELDRKNQELYELQQQMLESPKSERKALKGDISALDDEIRALQHKNDREPEPVTSQKGEVQNWSASDELICSITESAADSGLESNRESAVAEGADEDCGAVEVQESPGEGDEHERQEVVEEGKSAHAVHQSSEITAEMAEQPAAHAAQLESGRLQASETRVKELEAALVQASVNAEQASRREETLQLKLEQLEIQLGESTVDALDDECHDSYHTALDSIHRCQDQFRVAEREAAANAIAAREDCSTALQKSAMRGIWWCLIRLVKGSMHACVLSWFRALEDDKAAERELNDIDQAVADAYNAGKEEAAAEITALRDRLVGLEVELVQGSERECVLLEKINGLELELGEHRKLLQGDKAQDVVKSEACEGSIHDSADNGRGHHDGERSELEAACEAHEAELRRVKEEARQFVTNAIGCVNTVESLASERIHSVSLNSHLHCI